MSSSICTHFSQNAWKKDLCSNCFKSKDEHKQAAAALAASRSKYTSISTSLSASLSSKSTASSHSNDTKSDYPNKNKKPAKSIIKRVATSATTLSSTTSSSKTSSKHKSHKVSFPKNLSEVIGYGGEWSDDSDDDHDFMNLANDKDDDKALGTDDEESLELKRITRANTDFNMNNGNLLGDPQENIKKTFAALKLGAPQVDKEGKKQTLQINVLPFGAASDAKETTQSSKTQIATTSSSNTSKSSVKAKFESKTETKSVVRKTTTTAISSTSTTTSASSSSKLITDPMPSLESDGKNSPPIERAMEKSLLDEISETLEKNQTAEKLATEQKSSGGNSGNTTTTSSSSSASSTGASNKIKFEIGSLAESLENKTFLDLKKPIVRHTPITKDQIKPKVNVFNKYCDSDSNCSDTENGVSAYYDVVETSTTYENLPDGKYEAKEVKKSSVTSSSKVVDQTDTSSSIFSTSQYITDMLLSSKTRAASYNLHEGNFMTSKITSDGLIVTKCSSDDALDSTGSSFDGSSDEETSYNMIRSESDSGIGISIGHDYKNIHVSEKERDRLRIEKKLSASTNNSDYEDIQVNDQRPSLPLKEGKKADKPSFSLEKSRELHGEPDGSADPDGSLENQDNQELPALPKSPPPSTKVIDARPSFLHGLQKQHPPILLKKPDLPVKPLVSPSSSPMKSFLNKRSPAGAAATADQQQVISQLQMIMSKTLDTQTDCDAVKDESKLKKGKAPNPPPSATGGIEQKSSAPPTPERDYNLEEEFSQEQRKETYAQPLKKQEEAPKPSPPSPQESKAASNSATESGNASPAASIYTRKIGAMTSGGTVGKNSAAAAAIREKDKRDRAVINPKFRSLNTFATQRSNAIKNLQLQNATSSISFNQSMTPEAKPRNPKSLSASEENLNAEAAASKMVTPSMSITNIAAASQSSDKKSSSSSSPSAKTKTKFSIKKFLRMGASKTTENLSKPSKESIYSEICTGEDMGVSGKPRLVIIHPIDINTTAVEVVKDITKTNDAVATQTVAVVTAKPPAPPLRSLDTQRNHEMNKPARPPPPKSAELRRKQQIALTTSSASSSTATATAATSAGTTGGSSVTSSPKTSTSSSSSSSAAGNNIRIIGEQQSGSIKSKSDNVYANLGEIRSSIAPRKPERTASMREREAQLELARKRHIGGGAQHQGNSNGKENVDTISICSSNGDMVSADQQQQHSTNPNGSNTTTTSTSTSTTTNASKNLGNIIKTALAGQLSGSGGGGSRLEGKPPTGSRTSTFERKKNEAKPTISNKLEIFENGGNGGQNNSDTCSIASDGRTNSLKDSVRKINSTIDNYLKDKRDYENMYELVKSPASPPPPPARSADLQATQRLMQARRRELDTISVASYTRSEYGPVRNFGLNTSLANIPRMISASYCGSEMGDLDIYSPYSYYGSEAGGDLTSDINDSVWGSPSGMKNRVKATNRLRMRKGRSVVHKTIEDNYSAVVGANHEALAQVLEQLQQTPIIPPALRPLANAINLRFEDFTILEGAQAFVVGKKAFHAALWTTAPVTLALSADCNQLAGIGGELSQLSGGVSGALNPITEFCDIVPSFNLPLMPTTEVTLLQATISVLPRLQLDTLQSIGAILKGKSHVLDKSNFNFRGSIPNLTILKDTSSMAGLGSVSAGLRNGLSVQNLTTLSEETAGTGDMSLKLAEQQDQQQQQVTSAVTTNGIPAFDDVMTREVAFIMLQLINGMKHLQVKAVEEMPLSLSNVVLSKEYDNKDAQARLCVLQGNHHDEDEPMGTLCKCAHIALTEMLPSTKMTPILANILQQDRSESLSKSKSVLEFILWGPSDVQLTGSTKERETALQRWLDLERATVLHGLVRTRVELTVYDECHLMFLVRSTAKIMNDAAKIIANYQEHQQQQMKSNQLTKD